MSSLRSRASRKSVLTSVRPAVQALFKAAFPAAVIGCGLAFSPAHAVDYCTSGTGLCIEDADSTVSGQTFSGYSNAAIRFMPEADGVYLISDSVFEHNYAENGGAVILLPSASATLTIRDSEFRNNEADTNAGSVFTHASLANSDSKVVLNIVAESKDVLFEQNYAGAHNGHTDPEDFRCVDTTINLYAAEGKKISFDGIILTESIKDTSAGLNINKSGETYSYLDPVTGSIKTVKAQTGGEVVFGASLDHINDSYNSDNDYLDVRLYGGTLTVLETNSEHINNDNLLLVNNLDSSNLTVEGSALLRSREAEPVVAGDYYVSQKDKAFENADKLTSNVLLSRIVLGQNLTLYSNLMIQPAVDLSAATADNNATGRSDTYIIGSQKDGNGRLVVSGWIIKAEGELTSVTVDLAADNSLQDYFSLGDSGTVAVGPVHVWTVAQDGDKSSQFTFTMVNTEDEDRYFKPDPVSGEEGNEGDSEDEKEEDKSQTGSNSSDTPFNYNPDVYGGAVAALGTSVIQHALTEAVFADAGLRGKAAPERKQWWGTMRGADLNLKTKNFYGTEYDYALAVVGHNFEPLETAAGSVEFGAYLGAATGSAKYSNNKVRQNGGFAGASAVLKNGAAFAGIQTTFGVMNNRLRGYSDNSFTTPWFGAGATAGFALDVPAADLTVTPRINLSYVRVTGRSYTTSLDAKVENAALHSFETSPAIRLDKRFTAGWSAFGEARYAFVSKNGGRSTASYGSDVSALPSIAGKNYAEYGLGVRKDAKNAGISLNVSRADGGRSGWAGTLRADYRF
jgi:outer membrane autotransporter protein